MPYYMYVSLQDDDKIVLFTMDAGTGKLTPKGEVPVAGGPSPLTMSPDRKVLYVGHRHVPGISSFRIDPDTGALTQSGTVSPEAAPTFLSTDRKGRYVLSAYYQGAHAAVHPVGHDGAVGDPPIERWERPPALPSRSASALQCGGQSESWISLAPCDAQRRAPSGPGSSSVGTAHLRQAPRPLALIFRSRHPW